MTANPHRHLNRGAALASLTALVPVPLLDTWLENRVRRSVTRNILRAGNVTLPAADVAMLSDTPSRGFGGALLSLLTWPVRKLFRIAFFALDARKAYRTRGDVLRRAGILHEAVEYGLLPGDTAAVRERMEAV